jgi:hypothetical protein
MKTIILLLLGSGIFLIACQKSLQNTNRPANRPIDNTGDSTIMVGDNLSYEVLTLDTRGWFGIWNRPDIGLATNVLNSITYGSPVYLPSGWKYTFVSPAQPFQALISAAASTYNDDITVNLYRNGALIKSSKNDAMKGVAKLMVNAGTDSLRGTPADPVFTYEVLVSEIDTTKFESDGWIGQWNNAKGVVSDLNNRLALGFAKPSGWKYTFKPEHLPFTMRMAASPYTKDGAKVTINFFVNGQLVKSSASRDWIYNMQYTVQ